MSIDTDTNALGISTCTAQPIIGCQAQAQGYCRQASVLWPCPDIKGREGTIEKKKEYWGSFCNFKS